MSGKSGCMTFSRAVLILVDFGLMAAGLAMVGLALWFRYDERWEGALKSAIADTNPNPYEMWELKHQFRTIAMLVFWVLVGTGVAIALIALIGICGSCVMSRGCCRLYAGLILLLIKAQLGATSLLIIYRGAIMDKLYRYLTVAYQYNLPDSLVVQNRVSQQSYPPPTYPPVGCSAQIESEHFKFRCCGDGTFNSYNYVCQGVPLPNCVDMINANKNFIVLIGGSLLGVLIGIEVLSIIFSSVVICRRDPSPST